MARRVGLEGPRTSLTLPFWRSALGPLRTIVVVRNPLEVVTSLHRRNGFSSALGADVVAHLRRANPGRHDPGRAGS